MRFLKIGDAAKELGICKTTLRKWIDKDEIPHRTTPGGHRLVDVESYLEGKSKIGEKLKEVATAAASATTVASSATPTTTSTISEVPVVCDEKAKIFYCRVFSKKQKDDLAIQVKKAEELYPTHLIISDMGSSSNIRNKGFQSMLEKVVNKEVEEVVVFHKDVISRLEYDLVKSVFDITKTRLKIHDKSDSYKSKDDEVAENLMSATATLSGQKSGKKTYTIHNVTVNVMEAEPTEKA